MMSTSHAGKSPALAARWPVDAPTRTATFSARHGRRWRGGRGVAPCSVRAAGSSNTIGCLEAEPWGAAAPAPALPLRGLHVVAPAPGDDALAVPSKQRVHEVVLKQAALAAAAPRTARIEPVPMDGGLKAAFHRCGEVCQEYTKTFYLVWCRRTDELVDGPNASHISAVALDRWESRLEDIFAGRPYDMLDAALSDTVANFPVDIQPFRDMIEGMRMDLKKARYRSFDELYLYCYYVAGTVGLMSVPVMGISPDSRAATETVYKGALALGLANQLTNILRDVGEDYVITRQKGTDLSPAGRAGDGGALRRRHVGRPRHRRVEELHEGPDHQGQSLLQAGRGRRHRAQSGEQMAGVGFSAPVPADPRRDRGQRLQQLHQEGLRSKDEEADGAAQGVPEITGAPLFFSG